MSQLKNQPARPPVPMRLIVAGLGIAALTLAATGCRQGRQLEPTPVPRPDEPGRIRHEPGRPLPPGAMNDPLMYGEDAPFYNVPPPEAGPFVRAYNAVGRPRIVVFVNRTLEGAIVPTTEERILEGRRRVIETTGAAEVERTERTDTYTGREGYYGGRYGERRTDRGESLRTDGPTRIEERHEHYLPPGEYDELLARRVDYEALENALVEALSVRNEVTILTPRMVRQRLNAEEIAALEAGRPAVLDGLAERLGADVLVHVQARPTAQTLDGLELRIVAEALNTEGGESIGRANADFYGPMSAARLEQVSRYLARRLMDGMTGAWLAPPEPPRRPADQPQPPAQQAEPQQPAPEPQPQQGGQP